MCKCMIGLSFYVIQISTRSCELTLRRIRILYLCSYRVKIEILLTTSIPSLHQSEPESPFADIEDGLESRMSLLHKRFVVAI